MGGMLSGNSVPLCYAPMLFYNIGKVPECLLNDVRPCVLELKFVTLFPRESLCSQQDLLSLKNWTFCLSSVSSCSFCVLSFLSAVSIRVGTLTTQLCLDVVFSVAGQYRMCCVNRTPRVSIKKLAFFVSGGNKDSLKLLLKIVFSGAFKMSF